MKILKLSYLEKIKPDYLKNGWSIPKWISFTETMIKNGWQVKLIRSQSTRSKYLYIQKGDKNYKIRFSNHKASKEKELENDCDFYVGRGHKGTLTTTDLILKLCK